MRFRRQVWRMACGLGALAAACSGAAAQGQSPVLQRAEPIPTPGLPAQNLPPQGSPLEGVRPPTLPEVSPGLPTPAPLAPSAATPNKTLAISDVAVEGGTVFDQADYAPLIEGLAGPATQQSAIETARTALVNLYRNQGYVYTVVNAVIDRRRLRFEIIEGKVTSVRLDGDIGPAGTQVLRFLNHLTDGRPVNVHDLERWLLLASDVPGVSVRSVLNPSETDPGALTLVAQVTRRAVQGLFTSDNRAFQQTGPEELLLVGDFNSFTEFGEKTELSLYHSYNNTNTFGQASTEFFIGGSGLKFRVYVGDGESIPSGDLRTIGYDGVTRVFGGALSYPVIRQRDQTLNALAVFDALESDIAGTSGRGGNSVRSSFDSLRVARLGADYALLDLLFGADRSAADGLSVRVSQGIPGLGATQYGDPQAPRPGERTNFTKLGLQASRVQTLFQPYSGATVALKAALAGQFSKDVLPPAEKFYLGGPQFDRGFYYGQVTGDSALTGTLELQLTTNVPAPSFLPTWASDLSAQIYAFYDQGETWNNGVGDTDQRLRSTGLGTRFYIAQYAELDLEGVRRLTARPLGGAGVSALPGSAIYWQFLARY